MIIKHVAFVLLVLAISLKLSSYYVPDNIENAWRIRLISFLGEVFIGSVRKSS
jgi:hypothetical protein